MKKFWLIAVIILCIATVLGGKIYWNHKIGRISSSSLQSGINTSSGVASDFSLDGSSATINKQISALPKSLQKAASSALKNNGQVQIAMVGSENVQALSLLLQHQLDLTFGDLFFKVTAIDLGQINSLNLNQAKTADLFKNMSAKPDAVIFTPLLYNDNGKVGSGDTETVTGLFEEKIRLQYPKAAFFISLPNYSSDAPYINSRIDSLEAYVTDQKFQNLNYLSKWPKGNARANLVSSDGHTMNKAGQTVWINYVISQWGLKK